MKKSNVLIDEQIKTYKRLQIQGNASEADLYLQKMALIHPGQIEVAALVVSDCQNEVLVKKNIKILEKNIPNITNSNSIHLIDAYLKINKLDAVEKILKDDVCRFDNENIIAELIVVFRKHKYIDGVDYIVKRKEKIIKSSAAISNNLGSVYFDIGDYKVAEEWYANSIILNSNSFEAIFNIIRIRLISEKFNDALKMCIEVNEKIPNDIIIYCLENNNKINGRLFSNFIVKLLRILDDHEILPLLILGKGPQYYLRAINYLMAENNLSEINKIYEKLFKVSPNDKAINNNYGSYLFQKGEAKTALEHYKKITANSFADHHEFRNLGVMYELNNDKESAYSAYYKAYQINPKFQPALVHLLDMQLHTAQWEKIKERTLELEKLMSTDCGEMIGSLQLLSLTEKADIQHHYAKVVAKDFFKTGVDLNYSKLHKATKNDNRLRLAYFSYDFRDHPVSYLTAELFELHNKEKFQVYVLSYGPNDNGKLGYRKRIEKSGVNFIDLSNASTQQILELILNLNLDIIIDLTGNTRGTKSYLFQYNLAKVKIHWLGYISTMGTKYYDYIITDEYTSPIGYEQYFEEKLLRLPTCLQINDRNRIKPGLSKSKSDYGIDENSFVFASFSTQHKIQPEIFSAWLRILINCPNSIFLLASSSNEITSRLKNYAKIFDLDGTHDLENRLKFLPRVELKEHLERYRIVDLALDTYPIGSGTTASEAVWMECPMLVLVGELMYNRMPGSLMRSSNLHELVATNFDEYVEIAIKYYSSLDFRASIKNRLLNTLKLDLFDTPSRVKELEGKLSNLPEINQFN